MASSILEEPMSEAAADNGDSKGIACPGCGCCDTRVYYTRVGRATIKRVRICRHCGRKIPTYERGLGKTPPNREE